MERSEEIHELAAALAKAQGEMQPAPLDGRNPHFNCRYATLASVWEACRGPLSRHGLAVVQWPEVVEPGYVGLTTMLIHSSGQWMSSLQVAPLQKADPQAYGSAMTYLRRYGLAAAVGVCPDEDDAEAAMDRKVLGAGTQGAAKARTEQAVRGAEQGASYRDQAMAKPPNGQGELRAAQAAWHAALREHCGDLTDDERHEFATLLLKPPKPITTETGWDARKYQHARDRMKAHAEACDRETDDGPCPLLAEAMKALAERPQRELAPTVGT